MQNSKQIEFTTSAEQLVPKRHALTLGHCIVQPSAEYRGEGVIGGHRLLVSHIFYTLSYKHDYGSSYNESQVLLLG